MRLSPEEQRQLVDQGYARMPALLSPEQVRRLRSECDRVEDATCEEWQRAVALRSRPKFNGSGQEREISRVSSRRTPMAMALRLWR